VGAVKRKPTVSRSITGIVFLECRQETTSPEKYYKRVGTASAKIDDILQ
jgi:hypothetical protein